MSARHPYHNELSKFTVEEENAFYKICLSHAATITKVRIYFYSAPCMEINFTLSGGFPSSALQKPTGNDVHICILLHLQQSSQIKYRVVLINSSPAKISHKKKTHSPKGCGPSSNIM